MEETSVLGRRGEDWPRRDVEANIDLVKRERVVSKDARINRKNCPPINESGRQAKISLSISTNLEAIQGLKVYNTTAQISDETTFTNGN